ncbi:hypothetical protein QBC37DRAFT_394209 [Rhypophila decipiens]|uniref:Uncharacterized protein n=1 Tax=Rhypophila decipiens TaxID=261697 RepID=A0AAN6YP60_9PEZI|nr:hypothetical protein QBC37DRAFT_394209 [Rhypophila decipiens]
MPRSLASLKCGVGRDIGSARPKGGQNTCFWKCATFGTANGCSGSWDPTSPPFLEKRGLAAFTPKKRPRDPNFPNGSRWKLLQHLRRATGIMLIMMGRHFMHGSKDRAVSRSPWETIANCSRGGLNQTPAMVGVGFFWFGGEQQQRREIQVPPMQRTRNGWYRWDETATMCDVGTRGRRLSLLHAVRQDLIPRSPVSRRSFRKEHYSPAALGSGDARLCTYPPALGFCAQVIVHRAEEASPHPGFSKTVLYIPWAGARKGHGAVRQDPPARTRNGVRTESSKSHIRQGEVGSIEQRWRQAGVFQRTTRSNKTPRLSGVRQLLLQKYWHHDTESGRQQLERRLPLEKSICGRRKILKPRAGFWPGVRTHFRLAPRSPYFRGAGRGPAFLVGPGYGRASISAIWADQPNKSRFCHVGSLIGAHLFFTQPARRLHYAIKRNYQDQKDPSRIRGQWDISSDGPCKVISFLASLP